MFTSFIPHARIVRVSAEAIAGSFHPSNAIQASAEFVIVFPSGAHVSTCKSYVISQLLPAQTDIDEKERVGSAKTSLGLPQLEYVKLYGFQKFVSIVSVTEIPVASDQELERLIVYLTI